MFGAVGCHQECLGAGRGGRRLGRQQQRAEVAPSTVAPGLAGQACAERVGQGACRWISRSRQCPRARSGDPGPPSQKGSAGAAFIAGSADARRSPSAAFLVLGRLLRSGGRRLLGRLLGGLLRRLLCRLLGCFWRAFFAGAAFFLRVEGPAARRSARSSDGPAHLDRLDRVALAQAGVRGAVGDVGAEASVLHHDGQVGGRDRCRARAAAPRPPGPDAAWVARRGRGLRRG